jgi:hypothetical protein
MVYCNIQAQIILTLSIIKGLGVAGGLGGGGEWCGRLGQQSKGAAVVFKLLRPITGNSINNCDFFKLIISVSGWPLQLHLATTLVPAHAMKRIGEWSCSFTHS